MNSKSAITAIDRAGALLVFPIDNKKLPASLWSHFYPRSEMRWEWDESGDNRVAQLWHLKTALSTTKKVVYTKWFRGRATYFSRELFVQLLRALNPGDPTAGLSAEARTILSLLENESPLSTKDIKRGADLRGRASERIYEKALRELWSRLLVVAFGEVDDGAFPSLAVGSTRVLFEDLWSQAWKLDTAQAEKRVAEILEPENLFFKHFEKLKASTPVKKRTKKTAIPGAVRFDEL
jgi:hypothetical protein